MEIAKTGAEVQVRTFGDSPDATADYKLSTKEEDVAVLAGILRGKLYKDPEWAAIREVVSNALDAHKASGVDRKVQVRFPSRLDPRFVCRDFGPGLSEEDVLDLFLTFGASTKRASSQIGGFGLGCKAPLAMAASMTIVSHFEGVKKTYLVMRDEGPAGRGYKVGEEPTTETGIEISFPVGTDYSYLNQRAYERMWPWDDYIETNMETGPRLGKVLEVREGVLLVRGLWAPGRVSVSMGGILYPVDTDNLSARNERNEDSTRQMMGFLSLTGDKLVFVLPVGAVPVAPSRENIEYTQSAKSTILRLLESSTDLAKEAAQAEFNQLSLYHRSALLLYRDSSVSCNLLREESRILHLVKFDLIGDADVPKAGHVTEAVAKLFDGAGVHLVLDKKHDKNISLRSAIFFPGEGDGSRWRKIGTAPPNFWLADKRDWRARNVPSHDLIVAKADKRALTSEEASRLKEGIEKCFSVFGGAKVRLLSETPKPETTRASPQFRVTKNRAAYLPADRLTAEGELDPASIVYGDVDDDVPYLVAKGTKTDIPVEVYRTLRQLKEAGHGLDRIRVLREDDPNLESLRRWCKNTIAEIVKPHIQELGELEFLQELCRQMDADSYPWQTLIELPDDLSLKIERGRLHDLRVSLYWIRGMDLFSQAFPERYGYNYFEPRRQAAQAQAEIIKAKYPLLFYKNTKSFCEAAKSYISCISGSKP